MTRDELADALLEVRRHVRTDPGHVRAELLRLTGPNLAIGNRMLMNLQIGLNYIRVDPEVLEGYLYGAALELRLGRESGVAAEKLSF